MGSHGRTVEQSNQVGKVKGADHVEVTSVWLLEEALLLVLAWIHVSPNSQFDQYDSKSIPTSEATSLTVFDMSSVEGMFDRRDMFGLCE